MSFRFTLALLAVAGLSLAHAQEKDSPILFRAVLHDTINPAASLFYTDKTGVISALDFRPKALSETFSALRVNGSLVLYDKAAVDPENPAASVAASVRIPPDMKRAIIIVLPSAAGDQPAYRLLVMEDSEKAFPKGESRVLTLIGGETAIQAGEHRLPVRPGEITRVPPVRKVDDFNMAQTNFYYRHGGSWIAFTERQLQYIDSLRRIFIIYVTPGALSPAVSTIVDTAR